MVDEEKYQQMAKNKVLMICLFVLFHMHTISAVRITNLDVPNTAWDAVKLNCKYKMENDTLYSVKWYKDGVEFFRCLADGSVQEFPLEDIKIYHTGRAHTGSCFFELTALTPRSGGVYMCEVSLDWPTFQIVSKSAHLKIVEPSKFVQPAVTTTAVAPILEENSDKSKGPKSFSSSMILLVLVLAIHNYQLFSKNWENLVH